MKTKLLLSLLTSFLWTSLAVQAADPIRVYIRAGEKSHAPGAHEHPQFLEDWTRLLQERGAECSGGLGFPSAAELERTDVLVLHAQEAGNIEKGEQRDNLEAFLRRGGGLVVIHAGAVSSDHEWYKSVIGGSWRKGTTSWLEGTTSLYFPEVDHPIIKDLSNFDLDDEIYYDLDIRKDVNVLATAYTPKLVDTTGKKNTPKEWSWDNEGARLRAVEAVAKRKGVNIYDFQPQIWTYERKFDGASETYRSFVHIPGHWYRNFNHTGIRAMILRGIAWAAKRDNVDELCLADELGDALRYVEGGAPSPEEVPDHLEIHPDFEISLVASEPLINKPINLNWDEKGRLWVCETPEYPNGLRKPYSELGWMDSGSLFPGKYDRDPTDRISILSDEDGDGVMDAKKVFADKLELVTSFVFYKNGVIASSAPDIWFLEDTDGDDVADRRQKLYTNLGTRDTHSVINNLRWGSDGWIYATHGYSSSQNATSGDGKTNFGPIGDGVVRFRPDGSELEQYVSHGGNTWGMDITMDGEIFYTKPTNGNPLTHAVLPEYILEKGKIPGVSGGNGLLPEERLYPAATWEHQAYVQIDRIGGYTAASGCAIYEGGAWPDEWKLGYFTTEPTVNVISHFNLVKQGTTYSADRVEGRKEKEFIRSSNMWFRPIELRTGPDGALYVVDFCNQAIIHNDTRGPVHGPAHAALRPDRDHYYGRIWKVQHKQAKAIAPVSLDRTDIASLRRAAQSSNDHIRSVAQRILRDDHNAQEIPIGSDALKAYDEAAAENDLDRIIASVLAARDDWTRSALIAASSDRAVEIIEAALEAESNDSLLAFVSALSPLAITHGNAESNAARLLKACGNASSEVSTVAAAVLAALAKNVESPPPLTNALKEALLSLLRNDETRDLALPMAVNWDKNGELAAQTDAIASDLLDALVKGDLNDERRIRLARSLVNLRANNPKVMETVIAILSSDGSYALKGGLLAALGSIEGPDLGDALIEQFSALKGTLKLKAFDEIVKRADWTKSFLDVIDEGEVTPSELGPGGIARLRTHPDWSTAQIAKNLFDRISPETADKGEIIARLIPVVETGGDFENGKIIFGACVVCHKLGDVGAAVGPALDGMGARGASELLSQIIDPNREVEQNYWAHNITTRSGETFTGVISSENASTLTLATQVGVKEIAKSDIAKRENTKRSLMPEGFENLGEEGLRDLLSYLTNQAAKP